MEPKVVNVGVIGCSGMAEAHMRGVQDSPHAKLTAICDINPERMQHAAQLMGLSADRTHADYHDLLARDDVDAVILVTPDQVHREMILDSLAAGKHILCEKPLALTREDCEAIVAAVQQSDRKFMVGQICRYTPGFKAARDLVASGEIGELVFVESEYAHHYGGGLLNPGNWRCDPDRNGVVGGGCHAVDLLRWVVGGDPTEIKAFSNRKVFADLPYDDMHIAIMKFPGNVMGKVFTSVSCIRNYTMRSVFYGTKGTIICDNTSPFITVFRKEVGDGDLFAAHPGHNHEIPVQYPVSINNHNAPAEVAEFCKIIIEDLPVETTVLEGAKTVEACRAIVEAANTGETIYPNYNF